MENYYKSYDKNIISTSGGGKISKGSGIVMENREQTISSKLKNDVNYMPPLFRITDKDNQIKSNTYENPDNYVIKDGNLEDYYYSSQQMNDMNIINNSTNQIERNMLNMQNPIKSPPPLISYIDEDNLERKTEEEIKQDEKIKEKIREQIKRKILKKIKEDAIKKEIEKNKKIQDEIKKEISNKEKESGFKKIKENIGKNLWINENNLYSVKSTKSTKLPWKDKQYIINLSDSNMQNEIETTEQIENFATNDEEKKEIDYSIIIFIALMLIIAIVYVIFKNKE
jgi:hypothetical protein